MQLKITAGDRVSAAMQEFLHDNDSKYKYLDTDAPREAIKGDKHNVYKYITKPRRYFV